MKKGKWLVVLMAIVMVFSLGIFACTPTTPGPGTGPDTTQPSITLNQSNANLDLYDQIQLTATTTGVTGTVTWSSNNASVASVDNNGLVTTNAEGSATITATAGELSATCTVNVTNSYTAPVLEVLSNVGIAKDDSYTVKVKTLWKGAPISDVVTYNWVLADGQPEDIVSLTTANNGADATFTGLKYGSALYNVMATVRGTVVAADVLVTVANLDVTFDVANLQMGIGAFEANLGLLQVGEHVSSVVPEISVYNKGTLVENANLTITSANPEIARVEGGKIIAVSEGVANVLVQYEDSTLVIRANVYRPTITLQERVVVETSVILTENYLNVESDIQGEITAVKVNGRSVMESYDATKGAKIDGSKLPQDVASMGEGKEIIIETTVAKYVSEGAMYTLYITEASDLDLIKEASYAADPAFNYWAGYFALGNDIAYNKQFTPIHTYAELNELYAQNPGVTSGGDGPHDSRHNGFRGVLDGRGYNIDGMSMGYWAGGMFPAFCGTIKNISFTNVVLAGNTSLLTDNNAGTTQNVYMHVKELGASNGECAGPLSGGRGYAVTRMNNCFVDVPNGDGYAIGGAHEGYGVVNDVYAVGDTTPLHTISTGGGARNVYAGFDSYNDLVTNSTVDFSAWDRNFWAIVNGIPYPKNLPLPEEEPSVEVQSTTGYNTTVTATVGKYTVLSIDAASVDAGIVVRGSKILIPNNSALGGKTITVTASDVFGKKAPVTKTISVISTETIEISTVKDIDVKNNTFTIDFGTELDAITETFAGASINEKQFATATKEGSTFTFDTNTINGAWGDQIIYLTFEEKSGDVVVKAINVAVSVNVFRSISTKQEFIALESLVSMSGSDAYGNFKVTADIDLEGAAIQGVGTWSNGWTHHFKGTFDGQGHTISNFVAGGTNRGLFSHIAKDGVVKNIVFKNVYLPGTSGLVATQNDGLIENIFVYATMLETGKTWAPGSAIVAKAETTSTIRNAFVILDDHKIGATADDSFAGGIAGWTKGTVENAVLISLDEVKLYAVGQSATTIFAQDDTDTATVKSFQNFADFNNWYAENKEDVDAVMGWAIDAYEEVLTINCAVSAPSQFVSPGSETQMNFKKGYVTAWAIKENVDGVTVANGVVTVASTVTGGTNFTVVATTGLGDEVELEFTVVSGATVTVSDKEIDLSSDTALTVTFDTAPQGELANVTIAGIEVNATYEGGTLSVALTEIAKLTGFATGTKYPVVAKFAKSTGGVVTETTDVKFNVAAYDMIISNSAELDAFANVGSGYVVLDADFTYTGTYTRKAANFEGTFDGRGHIIKNFKTTTGLVSMLAHVDRRHNGCIKNLILLDAVGTSNVILTQSGAGQIENVYISIGASNSATGVLTADNYGDRRIRKVMVDFQGKTGHAINGYHEGYGIAESVIQIGGTSVVGSKWTDKGGEDGACIKLQYASWDAMKTAQPPVSDWDNDFWDIVNGVPVPATLASAPVEITNTQTSVLAGDNLTLTANGYFLNWTVEGAGATLNGNVLSVADNATGEITVTATNAVTGESDTYTITVQAATVTELAAIGDVEIADTTSTTVTLDVTAAFSGSEITEIRLDDMVVPTSVYTIDGNNVVIAKEVLAQYLGAHSVTVYAGTKKATTTMTVITKVIRNVEDLVNMENYDSNKKSVTWELWGSYYTEDSWTGYYVLGNDIDLTGKTVTSKLAGDSRVWNAGEAGFHGTFDGRGHYIYGGTYEKGGLFGHVNTEGVVKNVALVDVTLGTHAWSNTIAVSFWGSLENVLVSIAADNRGNGEGGAVIVNGTDTAKYNNVIVYDNGGRTTANAGKLSSYINHQAFGAQNNVYVFTTYYVAQQVNEGNCPVDPIAVGTTLTQAGVDKTTFNDSIWNLNGDIALFDSMANIVDVPVIKNVETEMHYGTTLTLVAEKSKYVAWSLDQTAIDAGFAVSGNVVSAPANGSLGEITIIATSMTSGKTATYTISVVSASIITGNSIGKVGVISSKETFTIDLSAVTSETITGEITSAAVGTSQFTTVEKNGNIVTLNRSAFASVNGDCTISLVFKDGANVTSVSIPAYVVTMYIVSEADLGLMANTIATYPNGVYELGADIVCTATYTSPTASFNGTFNGNGYTIYNFKATFALFHAVGQESVVKNVSFVNATVDRVGSVICHDGGGLIENVYVSVNMLNAEAGSWGTFGASVLFGDAFGSKRVNMVFVDYIQKTGVETAGMPAWFLHQQYGIMQNAYAVGVSQMYELPGETGNGASPEVFGAYATWADYETAAPDVSGWDNDFWDIVDGKPVPARLKATAFTLTQSSDAVTTGSTVAINGWAYANLTLDQAAIDAGFTLAGNVLSVPADAAGKSATVTATAIYDETVTGSITITVAGTIELSKKVNADVKNATFTVDLSTVKESVGDIVSVKAGDKTFATTEYVAETGILTLDTATLAGVWGDIKLEIVTSKSIVSANALVYRSIATANEFANIKNYTTLEGAAATAGSKRYGYFVLTEDIDATGVNINFGGWFNGWGEVFQGTFDGQGHSIYNLTENDSNGGIFSSTTGATVIKNVNFYNATIGGNGGLISTGFGGTLENVFVSGKITGGGANWANTGLLICKGGADNAAPKFKNVAAVLEDNKITDTSLYAGILMGEGSDKITLENVITVQLGGTKTGNYNIGKVTLANTVNNESDTVKAFDSAEAYVAWLNGDGATAEWATTVKGYISNYVGTKIQPTTADSFVAVGSTAQVNVAQKDFVASIALKNAVDGITVDANGLITVADTVANNTEFTVVVTAFDGTVRELTLKARAVTLIEKSVSGVDVQTSQTVNEIVVEGVEDLGEIVSATFGGAALDGVTVDGNKIVIDGSKVGFANYGDNKTFVVKTENGGDNYTVTITATVVTRVFTTADDLANFWNYTGYKNSNVYYDGYYVLGADIEYDRDWTCQWLWTSDRSSAGGWYSNAAGQKKGGFVGIFDGRGHYIDGIKVNTVGGLFGATGEPARLRNVAFTNVTFNHDNSSFVALGGGISISNIYVQVNELRNGASPNGSGVLLGADSYGCNKISNVFVDIKAIAEGVAESEATANESALGRFHNGYGVLSNVFVVTQGAKPYHVLSTGGGAMNDVLAYTTRADMAAATNWQTKFNDWDKNFWATDADGLPTAKCLVG